MIELQKGIRTAGKIIPDYPASIRSDTLQETFDWFTRARPEPTDKDFHSQLGCHFEEVREMVCELTPIKPETALLLDRAKLALGELASHLKNQTNAVLVLDEDAANFLDALCDQVVTATGCAYVAHLPKFVKAMQEVNASNYSKFDENGQPIFDQNKKVMKGPNYRKANLAEFVA